MIWTTNPRFCRQIDETPDLVAFGAIIGMACGRRTIPLVIPLGASVAMTCRWIAFPPTDLNRKDDG